MPRRTTPPAFSYGGGLILRPCQHGAGGYLQTLHSIPLPAKGAAGAFDGGLNIPCRRVLAAATGGGLPRPCGFAAGQTRQISGRAPLSFPRFFARQFLPNAKKARQLRHALRAQASPRASSATKPTRRAASPRAPTHHPKISVLSLLSVSIDRAENVFNVRMNHKLRINFNIFQRVINCHVARMTRQPP